MPPPPPGYLDMRTRENKDCETDRKHRQDRQDIQGGLTVRRDRQRFTDRTGSSKRKDKQVWNRSKKYRQVWRKDRQMETTARRYSTRIGIRITLLIQRGKCLTVTTGRTKR